MVKWKHSPTEKSRKARPDAEYTVHVRFNLSVIREEFSSWRPKVNNRIHMLYPALGNQRAPWYTCFHSLFPVKEEAEINHKGIEYKSDTKDLNVCSE